MKILNRTFEVNKAPLETFEEITKKKYLRESFKELEKVKISNTEINEEKYILGEKETIEYTLLNELIKGKTKMIVTGYIKPLKITEMWIGGVFVQLTFDQEIEETERGSKVTYTIEYETSLPKLIRRKVEKDKIDPYLKKLMITRAEKIKKGNKRFKIERGDLIGGEEIFE